MTYSACEWRCSKVGLGGLRVQVSSGTCQPAGTGAVSEEIVGEVERRSGTYGYLSSQVYSADMFYSVFKKDPMNAKEGRRYRHTVLEKGGSQDEMKSLEEFLGRAPSTEAFYKELGLA